MSAILEFPQRHRVDAIEYLRKKNIQVYRAPSAKGYRTRFTATGKQKLTALALPRTSIALAELFEP